MGIVAPSKKVREIEETYLLFLRAQRRGKDQVNDGTTKCRSGQDAGRYKQAGKKEKGLILAEFIKLTEYARAYARQVLRKHGRGIRIDQRTMLVADVEEKLARSKRPRVYDEKVVAALIKIWKIWTISEEEPSYLSSPHVRCLERRQ